MFKKIFETIHPTQKIKAQFQQALALHQAGALQQAEAMYLRITRKQPQHANSLHFLGVIAYQKKECQRAMELIHQAITINPNSAAFYSNLGVVQMELRLYQQALVTYQKAIALNPNNADFYYNQGNALAELKHLNAAIESYQRAIALNPDMDFIFDYLLQAKMHLCQWDGFDALLAQIVKGIESNKKATPFTMLSVMDNPSLHKKAAEHYVRHMCPASDALPALKKHPKHGTIRIGYFSSDFRNHPVAALTAQLYELHNRNIFEIHAFALCKDSNDEMNLRIKAGVDHFHGVWDMSDIDIAMLARQLEIDIAVDLGGHTKESRTAIFAFRAAPIQLSYIGYLGTMGASYFDYLIADKIMVPKESRQHYLEKIVYLPHFQVNDGKRVVPTAEVKREAFGLPKEGFVFCCFNNSYKITPDVFAAWMNIVKCVEGSVLLMYAESDVVQRNLQKEVAQKGLALERVIFSKRLPMHDYLARYKVADLFLDTLPYNAGATASDALRMGLPVLTCMGESYASRMAASLLHALDLAELVTVNRQEYETLAINLARHPARLKAVKEKLAKNLTTTPLFDCERFTKNIERAYVCMYERCQNGLAVDDIDVGH